VAEEPQKGRQLFGASQPSRGAILWNPGFGPVFRHRLEQKGYERRAPEAAPIAGRENTLEGHGKSKRASAPQLG
jgi:hypothetical protein